MTRKIITFEGIECSGKGEQSKRLLAYFQKLGQRAILTREPGGTIYGEALRAILKHPEQAIDGINLAFQGHEDFPQIIDTSAGFSRNDYCTLFMFLAARAEFVAKIIKPAIANDQTVIIDRFADSTRAYQGGGGFERDPKMIITINLFNEVALQGIKPDLTIFLDISIDEMLVRRRKSMAKDAYFEKNCDLSFFTRVRHEYLSIAHDEPDRFKVVNGNQTIDQVWADVLKLIQGL